MKTVYFELVREKPDNLEEITLYVHGTRGRQRVFRGNANDTHIVLAGLRAGIEAMGGDAVSKSPDFRWEI